MSNSIEKRIENLERIVTGRFPVAAYENPFQPVYIGNWGGDASVPLWLAMRIQPVVQQIVLSKQSENKEQASQYRRQAQTLLQEEYERCGNEPVHWPFPIPKPHWSDYLQYLGHLADSLPANSLERDAAFESASMLIDIAHTKPV